MKKIELEQMEQVSGGNFIKWTGIISCAGATMWPIGTLIAGPTCIGMITAAALS